MRSTNAKFFALLLAVLVGAVAVAAQQPQPDKRQTRPRTAAPPPAAAQSAGERLEPDDKSAPARADVSPEALAARHESLADEEAAANVYVNNFLTTYRLGPEDVISITVFGPYQERYSKVGIVIPPHAKITHPLFPEGVFVGGKTTQQVQQEITKILDECCIIDPKVDVSLDKAQSAVFWVVGDVARPGIIPMTRRVSVTEALYLSGGVLETGNKKKVVINRRTATGFMQPQVIDVAAIEKGKQPDNFFLQPGDQVLVPGNRMKTVEKWIRLASMASLFRIFTGGF